MTPRLTILVIALFLAIATAVSLRRSAGSRDAAGVYSPPPASSPATKLPRLNDSQWARIYPGLLEIAVELHRHPVIHLNDLEKGGGFAFTENSFLPFALQVTVDLETEEIRKLIAWMESLSPSFTTGPHIYGYLPALYSHWGTREPGEAGVHVLSRIANSLATGRSIDEGPMRAYAAYGFVLSGAGAKDPKAAWQTFLTDEAAFAWVSPYGSSYAILGIFQA